MAARDGVRQREIEENVSRLQRFPVDHANGRIGEGALIQMKTGKDETDWFFVLPCCFGEDFHIPDLDATVTIVSPRAPIIEAAASVDRGTDFQVNNITRQVVNVF